MRLLALLATMALVSCSQPFAPPTTSHADMAHASTACTMTFTTNGAKASLRIALSSRALRLRSGQALSRDGEGVSPRAKPRGSAITITPSTVTLTPANPLAEVVVQSASAYTSASSGPCATLWTTAGFGGPYNGKLDMYVGRADFAGDCFLYPQTAPVPSSPTYYGGAEIEYDLGDHPVKLPHGPFAGGGIKFDPYLVLLTKSQRSAKVVLTTRLHGHIPAVPPPSILGNPDQIRPYSVQCHQNWPNENSQNGLVIAPTSYEGPRETFDVRLH